MIEFFGQFIDELASTFLSPTKRVFVGYLASALLLGFAWLWFVQRQSFSVISQTLFSRKLWLSSSAKTDYLLWVGNKVIMALLSPLLLGQMVLAGFLFESLHHIASPQAAEDWPVWLVVTLFTLVLFLLDDASRYLLHRWLHHSPTLWQFHRVHHTATKLTPFTIFRSHPVEGVLFSLRSALVQGFCIGVFVFFFGSSVDLVTIFGINVLLFLFNTLGANLRHSPVSIPYPKSVEKWLISPAQHQLHHSTDPDHFNINYGVVLSVWDRVGGTLHHSERDRVLDYGIKLKGEKVNDPILKVYILPFQDNGRRLLAFLRSALQRR
jgi:sterol desaturase/sphingolipid hydroxylase (fatty acid hydroxylase superfamily)